MEIKDNSTLVIPIYRVDKVKCNTKFCKNFPLLNDHSENGDWAGNGMYFWDNYSSAKYWIRLKRKHHKDERFNIIKATLCTDTKYLLDLTDIHTIKDFQHQLNQLVQIVPFPRGFKIRHIGSGINLYHQALTEVSGRQPFKAVKVIGMYPNSRDVINFKTKKYLPHITNKVKTIFRVY